MDFLYTPRENDSLFHILTARKWLEVGRKEKLHTPLIYSAIEYRLACERVLFELYLFLNNPSEFDREEEKRNIKSTSGLISAIHRVFENKGVLKLAQIFNQVYASFLIKDEVNIAIVDTGKLHSYWNHLSDLCHMQIEPNETWESEDWIEKHYKKLEEIDEYLSTIFNNNTTIGWVQLNSIPEEALDVRKDFMDRQINKKSMERRLKMVLNTLDGMEELRKTI